MIPETEHDGRVRQQKRLEARAHEKSLTLPEILKIPPKLLPMVMQFNEFRFFLLEGGRGSAKTQSAARLILFLCEQRKIRVVCGREQQNSIEESVYTVLKDLIEEFNLPFIVQAKKITHRFSGSEILFKGFREQGRVNIKGLEGCDLLWIDEGQSITKATLDVIVPTIRKAKSKIIFTMNRFMRDDAVHEYFATRAECLHITINYNENPFCPHELKIEADNMRARSDRDYRHIWLGEPLSAADDFLFDFDKLHASFDIKPFGETFGRQRVLGIDFAAQGNDLCVATIIDRKSNQHWELAERIPWSEPDPMVSIGRIVNLIGQYRPDVTILDVGGMGHVVWSRLNEMGVDVKRFDGGSTEGVDTVHYRNVRCAGYYTLYDWFNQGFLCIDGSKHREVINQLEKIRFRYLSNGSRVIEDKLKMKKDLGYSPDDADSVMMAVYGAVKYLGKTANRSAVRQSATRKSVSPRITGGTSTSGVSRVSRGRR